MRRSSTGTPWRKNWFAVRSNQRYAGPEDQPRRIAQRFAKFPQVRSLRLFSGDYDFDMVVGGESIRETSRFISERVAPVPEITQTVTHYLM
ncbi:MAG: Lrp/AsnC ligand binding domain-containing protein, partial [Natronomonas sp.]|nr:Lrp/AsnC ligand binding domain-containing protein [Natronomonas sp.]